MPTYGVTDVGFVAKPAAVVQAEIDSGLKKILGDSAGTEPDGTIPLRSIAGQMKAFLTDGFAAMWDLDQAIYASFDPNSATGSAQDAVCAITGTIREALAFSRVTAACTGVPGTVLQLLRVATVSITKSRFLSGLDPLTGLAPVIASVSAWQAGHGYVLGDRVHNLDGSTQRVYQCRTAGTSAGSGGPTGTGSDITDNTAHWMYLGDGTGAIDVPFTAERSGVVGALSGTLVTIGTPVQGWIGVYNVLDAAVGAGQEIDSALRARRDAEASSDGNATRDAIRANILRVNQDSSDPNHVPPKSCKVFFNDTDVTDGDGVLPHSVEVLVLDGTDQDIAQAVWDSVAAGIRTVGGITSTVTDSEGNPQTVKWSRPTAVPIWIVATVYYDAKKWPSAGAGPLVIAAAKSSLLTFAVYPIGESVRTAPLSASIFEGPSAVQAGAAVVPAPPGSVPAPGILDVTPFYIGTAPAPGTGTPIAITSRQIPTFDSARIDLTATPEAP